MKAGRPSDPLGMVVGLDDYLAHWMGGSDEDLSYRV